MVDELALERIGCTVTAFSGKVELGTGVPDRRRQS